MKIGKILWVINGDAHTIVPVKIVEKITKETLQGEQIEFVIETTSGKKLNLSNLKDRYYETIDEARNFLLTAAQNLINEIVDKALNSSKKFQVEHDPVQLADRLDTIDHAEVPTAVELPDGTMARVRIKVPQMIT